VNQKKNYNIFFDGAIIRKIWLFFGAEKKHIFFQVSLQTPQMNLTIVMRNNFFLSYRAPSLKWDIGGGKGPISVSLWWPPGALISGGQQLP
jgi:hypothetical protein